MTFSAYHIIIDESGDPSQYDRCVENYVMAASVVKNTTGLDRCMRKLQKKANLHIKGKEGGKEIKASSSKKKDKIFILNEINKQEIKIKYININKNKSTVHGNNLYCILLERTVQNCVEAIPKGHKDIRVLIDSSNRIKKNQLEEVMDSLSKKMGVKISFTMASSSTNLTLRAHDFITNALFVYYERGDSELFEIIKSKIIEDPGGMVTG